jgi:hypothetical protein
MSWAIPNKIKTTALTKQVTSKPESHVINIGIPTGSGCKTYKPTLCGIKINAIIPTFIHNNLSDFFILF